MTELRYELQFAPKAIRSLRKLDHAAARRIRETAEALRDDQLVILVVDTGHRRNIYQR